MGFHDPTAGSAGGQPHRNPSGVFSGGGQPAAPQPSANDWRMRKAAVFMFARAPEKTSGRATSMGIIRKAAGSSTAGFIAGYLVEELLTTRLRNGRLDNYSKHGPVERAFDTNPSCGAL
jgi:hypothetical protein